MTNKNPNSWRDYNTAGAKNGPRPRLFKTLDRFFATRQGVALDLGCGGGRDTRELLTRGWRVDSVDDDEDAIELTLKMKTDFENLIVTKSSFENIELKQGYYDLINASYSLPFCHPKAFPSFWQKVKKSLKPDGLISCEFFGINDSWAMHPTHGTSMTFLDKATIENISKDLRLEFLKEEQYEGTSFSGALKNWHVFIYIASKATD
jgi:tellurite methyltransferase